LKELVISGNEAIAYGAIRGGCCFFAGYPITPSSEIAEVLSLELPKIGGKFIQMEDEMGSLAGVIGASLTGKKAMTATSGPGFSLMQEHIGFAIMGEVPCVIVDVQRGGPSTGLPTHPSQGDVMQTRWGTHGDHEIIVLSPSSVQECYTLIIEAFNLSEQYRTPVIFLTDEVIGHLREKLIIPDDESINVITRKKPKDPPDTYKPFDMSKGKVPPLANFGSGYKFHITGLIHDETGFPTDDSKETEILLNRLTHKIIDNRDKIVKTEAFMMDDAEIALIAYGSVFRTAKETVIEARENGIKIGALKLTTIWPFADKEISEVAEQVESMVVVEMNLGQLKSTIESCIKGKCDIYTVCRADGNIVSPSDIHSKLKEVGIVH
jgi:2-oxoglutarate ferredoxin oxidoreductase subunit alpha